MMMKQAIFLIVILQVLILSGCAEKVEEENGKIDALNQQIELQSGRLEDQQKQIEALQDSISQLQLRFERIHTHAEHAYTDVRQARSWAKANGYGSTLAPSIDNVLYDLEAISQYSSLSSSLE